MEFDPQNFLSIYASPFQQKMGAHTSLSESVRTNSIKLWLDNQEKKKDQVHSLPWQSIHTINPAHPWLAATWNAPLYGRSQSSGTEDKCYGELVCQP